MKPSNYKIVDTLSENQKDHMNAIIQHPKVRELKNLELTCVKELVSFYEKYGFSTDYGIILPMRRENPKAALS